ncbi:hypothetical protein PPL_00813 [Heterostelium album PN500]|uniref:RGS domain-containing protein n=1 Tax=Heterostelium pallidum (strain ATCC 26659 / Pp 5 / PN500) TaxID=670386 RepID=D3AXI2_HETP5|nr:hypothetical protein PPL_00813 [Heterostelium album PN500]EFA86251.1 hypothetical protein PPL_00813 [Heterostelium album PN500]|eukprot:XP_020438356.1 hypothetical protein PPL_00813 [Heterostelium album PN500]
MLGLDQIVQNKSLALLFRKFLYERYNNENFSFWLEAENYKHISSDDLRSRRSKEIYEKYFNTESKYELNVDHIQRKDLEGQLGTPTNDLFIPIQLTIRKLMEMDAIPLFVKSESYKKFKENELIEIELSSTERDRSVTICEMEEFLKTHPAITK